MTDDAESRRDTGDHAVPDAPDPTPEEITDPMHDDYVDAFPGAVQAPEVTG